LKRRQPNTFEDALVKIMGVLTPEGAGAVIGVSAGRIRAAADPDRDPASPLNVEQCLKLDAAYNDATGDGYPLMAVYERRLQALSPAQQSDPVQRLASAVKETSEAVQAYAAGKPVHELEREVAEAVTELNNLVLDRRAGLSVVRAAQ